METAALKLSEASQKMGLLRKNVDNYDTRKQLELATTIRDSILYDSSVVQGCDRDVTLTERRKKVLEEIKNFQLALISKIQTTINNDGNVNYNEKFDYSVAKMDLILLAEKELNDNTKWAKLVPDEVSLVKDFNQHTESLYDVIDRCRNDKYTILLMGEYQSGKTTTLNAICEGRQIGAIGKGSKTSAVPLSISYSQNDSIVIRWKTKNDFLDIFSHLRSYMPDLNCQDIDIDNTDLRNQLLDKIEVLRSNFKNINKKDQQFVALCSIVLYYWNSDKLIRIKETNITLGDIGAMSKFPDKFITRWKEKGASGFSIIESAFAFIKQIDCLCDSNILKSLNCSIMDCPGLFANEYDTQVTLKVMNEADAILYILPRERQAGEAIDESLDTIITQYGDLAQRKLVIANNLSLIAPNTETIYNTNRDSLNLTYNNQFDLEIFDAKAAYLSEIKHAYDNDRLDKKTISDFINSIPPKARSFKDIRDGKRKGGSYESFVEAWTQAASVYGDRIHENGLDELLTKLIDFVNRNKALSVVITKGVDRLFNELKQSQIDLKTGKIEPYTKGREKLEQDWKKRIDRLQEFDKDASAIVNETLFGSQSAVSPRLSDAIYLKLFPNSVYDSMMDKICDRLYSEAATLKKMEKKDEKKYNNYIENIVTECITDVVQGRVLYWNNLMTSNQDLDVKNIFEPAINSMEVTLLAKWKEKYCDDESFKQSMGNYYPINGHGDSFSINSNEQSATVKLKQGDISSVVSLNRAAIAVGITGVVGYGAGLILALSGPIGWLIAGVVVLGTGIFGMSSMEEYNNTKFKKKVKPDLEKQLDESGVKDKIREMIKTEVNRILMNFKSHLKVDIELANRNRDIAISALDNPQIEPDCFKSVGAIERLEKQKGCYRNFKSNL